MTDEILHRYTDLPALIYLLKERKVTLLDPQSWDDKNDSYFLELYKQKKHLKSVLALCFTQESETYHHWRVFAAGSSGVRIEFRRKQFIGAVRKRAGVRTGAVEYLTLKKIDESPILIKKLPFLKRHAFKHENEFRLLYESKKDVVSSLDVSIPLSCIRRVTLSPWMHPSLDTHVKDVLRSLVASTSIEIARSTLISNQRWKKAGDTAV